METAHPWRPRRVRSGLTLGFLLPTILAACEPSRPPVHPSLEVTGSAPVGESAVVATAATIDLGAAAARPEASDELLRHVRLVGRFDTTDPSGPRIDWSGGRILARFRGDGISVRMADATYGGGDAQWDVTIDGHLQTPPLALHPGEGRYELASGLSPGTHTVELWKRTEANVSTTQLLGFEVSQGELVEPPPAASRRLEFLGDSVSTGYGVLGKGPSCAFSPATENDHVAFPALVAESLGADHQNLAYSGRGVSWNFDRKDPNVLPRLYGRTRATVPAPLWSFDAFVPDVVWITLGGNDWDQPHPGDPPPELATFEEAYDRLVATVRQKHPDALIVCAIAPSLNDDYPSVPPYRVLSQMRTALGDLVARAQRRGDAKVVTFEFERAGEGALTGCGYHPNAEAQSSLARQATAFLKTKMGWN